MTNRRWIALLTLPCLGAGAIAACTSSSSVTVPVVHGEDAGTDASIGTGADAAVGQGGEDAGSDAAASIDSSTACPLDGGATGTLCDALGCIDTTRDPASCGGCVNAGSGTVCDAGFLCSASRCQDVAGPLSGLRWALPCTSPSNGINCPTSVDGSVEVVTSTTLGGTSGQTYEVTLRFRGIVEQRTYSGYDAGGAIGAEDGGGSNPGFFIAGGDTPSPDDTWNIYELDISNPPQTYYLNSGSDGINDVWLVDYLATLPMAAGATITLTANSVEGIETSNQGSDGGSVYVPGVPPYPQAYDGQFVQMDVTSVVPSP